MKHFILILLLIGAGVSLKAQVEFKAEISKDAVMLNEPFRVEYQINKNFDNFNLTDNENFEVLSGPSTSFQQSMNMTNGKIEKTISVKYTYILKAKTPGSQNIPSAEVKINGNYYYSAPKEIIVIDSEYKDPKKNEMKDIEGTSKS
jgi:hypothetical protein